MAAMGPAMLAGGDRPTGGDAARATIGVRTIESAPKLAKMLLPKRMKLIISYKPAATA